MYNTVECPYCEFENDMSDGLTDLPSDNKFDYECTNCEEEFEIFVEFEPIYSSDKIVYEDCDCCGKENRDIKKRGLIFPYPSNLYYDKLCYMCFRDGILDDFIKSKQQ